MIRLLNSALYLLAATALVVASGMEATYFPGIDDEEYITNWNTLVEHHNRLGESLWPMESPNE